MPERKIIFECRVGSHLYGTNHASSDEDFMGVFLPSTEDLLSLDPCPQEWVKSLKVSTGPRNSAGDVDRKYWSLQRFCQLASQGQPGALELFFAPPEMVLIETEEWSKVKAMRSAFISRNSIVPFLRFAAAQAHKASIKGDNLNQLRKVLAWIATLSQKELNVSIAEIGKSQDGRMIFQEEHDDKREVSMDLSFSENGSPTVSLAGRQWNIGSRVKSLRDGLQKLEARYGSRSEIAASSGQDWKSLSHAYRLLFEAEELLETGWISLPLTSEVRDFIMKVKRGEIDPSFDFRRDLDDQIMRIQRKSAQSTLPDNVEKGNIQSLCQSLLLRHLHLD